MRKINHLLASLLLFSGFATASDQNPVVVQSNQAIIQVKGIVCSFCAHGTEKNLAKLNFLDPSQFDGDGVLIDIHTHRITLALTPDQPVDYDSINAAILKGGYDPVATYVRLRGSVQQDGGRYLLTSADNGQVYTLTGQGVDALVGAREVAVQGHLGTGDVNNGPVAIVLSTQKVVL